jgi:hypothetical protein
MKIHDLPAADRLAALRRHIKLLEERERVLRDYLLATPGEHTGEAWKVEIASFVHRRLDLGAATMRLGADLLQPFTIETEFRTVRLISTKGRKSRDRWLSRVFPRRASTAARSRRSTK